MRKMILDRTQKFWAVWIVLFGLGAVIFFVVGVYPTGFLMAVTAALGEVHRRLRAGRDRIRSERGDGAHQASPSGR